MDKTIESLEGLTKAWFDFIDEIGGVDNLNQHPVRRDELRRLIKVYLDAYANPPEGVIGVGAITYAEQCLMEAQK